MGTIKQKLSSRKLWTAIVGVIMGIAMVFGLDENVISTVAGAIVSLVSAVTYIYTEGKIDATALGQAAQDVQNAVDVLDNSES